MGPTFQSMEHFQTNKEVKTLEHKMIFRDVSFIFVLNSSHFSFTLKTEGGSDVSKLKGLSHQCIEVDSRFDKEKFVGLVRLCSASPQKLLKPQTGYLGRRHEIYLCLFFKLLC